MEYVRRNTSSGFENRSRGNGNEATLSRPPSTSLSRNNQDSILDSMDSNIPNDERERLLSLLCTRLAQWNQQNPTNFSAGNIPEMKSQSNGVSNDPSTNLERLLMALLVTLLFKAATAHHIVNQAANTPDMTNMHETLFGEKSLLTGFLASLQHHESPQEARLPPTDPLSTAGRSRAGYVPEGSAPERPIRETMTRMENLLAVLLVKLLSPAVSPSFSRETQAPLDNSYTSNIENVHKDVEHEKPQTDANGIANGKSS
jgi:hypothetical protein